MISKTLNRLRGFTVLVPVILAMVSLAILSISGLLYFETWVGFALLASLVALGIAGFSTWVFRQFYHIEARLLLQNKQLEALNQAAAIVTSELSVERVLQEIVEQSRQVLDARYSAISVFPEKGEPSYFHASGIPAETRAQMGSPPQGRGLLGEVHHLGKPLRISDIARHPKSLGFPAHHPKMTTLLGVPIKTGDRTIGLLYLADKSGGLEFTAADEEIGVLFARQASIALHNARLFRHSQEMTEDLTALITVGRAVGSSLDLNEILERALDTVIQVTSAEFGEVWLTEPGNTIFRVCYRGTLNDLFGERTRFRWGEGFPGSVAKDGQPIIVHDLQNSDNFVREAVKEAGINSVATLPLRYRDEKLGALVIAARDKRALSQARELRLLEGIGELISTAITNARLHAQTARLAVLEERERIGMDIHDGAIQSLYAVGLGLAGVSRTLDGEQRASRETLEILMRQLNQVIMDIRGYILDTRVPAFAGFTLVTRLQEIVEDAQKQGETAFCLEITDEVTELVPAGSSIHLIHILSEAISNIQRHSRAKHAWVKLQNMDSKIVLRVEDDGCGFDTQGQKPGKMGLRNIEARVHILGGSVEIVSEPGVGTRIAVELPLGAASEI